MIPDEQINREKQANLPTLNVLILEDNPDHVEIIRRAAKTSDYPMKLHFVATLKEARNWLTEHVADLIVADIHLPDGSGLELLNHQNHSPAVIITNQGSDRHAVEAMKQGALDYIVKSPENFRQLPYIIHRTYEEWQVKEKKRQTEEILRQNQNRLAGLYRTAPVGLGLIRDLVLIECNDVLAQMLGYSRAEILGKKITELHPQPFDILEMVREIEEKLEQSPTVEIETPLSTRDGKMIEAQIRLTLVDLNEPAEGIIFSINDITEYRTMIRQLIQKEEKLMSMQDALHQKVEFLQNIHRLDLILTEISDPSQAIQSILEGMVALPKVCTVVYIRAVNDSEKKPAFQWYHKSPCYFDETLISPLINCCFHHGESPKPSYQFILLQKGTLGEYQSVLVLNLAYQDHSFGKIYLLSTFADAFTAEWGNYAESLAIQISVLFERFALIESLQHKQKQIEDSYEDTIRIWSQTLDMRDQETSEHTERVANLACALAKKMGIEGEELRLFRYGAILHDIGKIRIPDRILLKPDKLSDEEWVLMRQHPLFAKEMLEKIAYLERVIVIPLYHHERWDGSGYPFGLKGTQIPLWARIFSVVDVWDALTSDRPYRPAWTRESAKKYIKENAGKLFDPFIVQLFFEILE